MFFFQLVFSTWGKKSLYQMHISEKGIFFSLKMARNSHALQKTALDFWSKILGIAESWRSCRLMSLDVTEQLFAEHLIMQDTSLEACKANFSFLFWSCLKKGIHLLLPEQFLKLWSLNRNCFKNHDTLCLQRVS